MTHEQLKVMTNKELDKLAAIKFLWNGFINEPSDDWKPTEDMNQAMKLCDILRSENWDMVISMTHYCDPIWDCKFLFDGEEKLQKVYVTDSSPSRSITIAAILAKGQA